MLTIQSVVQWLPAPGTAAVCAVSGGLDSMCLLHVLWTWCGERGIPLTAAHFHHGLRETADRDETFVRDWCGERGIPFTAGRGDVRGFASRNGLSLEEAARDLRYTFLRETAAKLSRTAEQTAKLSQTAEQAEVLSRTAEQAEVLSRTAEPRVLIYTAHHAGDNVETVLLNLIRGTGIRGLTGMRRRRDGIVRPFLDVTRDDLKEYAAAHGIPHVEDETNADPSAAARNRVRLDILPLLRALNPRAGEHIREAAAQLAEIDSFLEQEARRRMASAEASAMASAEAGGGGQNAASMGTGGGRTVVPCELLADAPPCLRPRILFLALDRLGAGRKNLKSVHLNAVLSLLEAGDGRARRLALPGGVTTRWERDLLILERRPQRLEERELVPGVPVLWGQYRVTLLETAADTESAAEMESTAEKDRKGNLLVIRDGPERLTVAPVRPADRLRLPGSSGSRTVKRLCLDRRISPEERDGLPAVYADGRLAAVRRLGTDAAFLPADGAGASVRRILVETAAEKF